MLNHQRSWRSIASGDERANYTEKTVTNEGFERNVEKNYNNMHSLTQL